MKAQQLTLSRFVVFIALLLILVPGVAVLAAAPSQPVDPATPEMLVENTGCFDPSAHVRGHAGSDSMVIQTAMLQDAYSLQGENVTKTVTPTGQVRHGDELTYTLVISAAPGVQLGLYDPLTTTTFMRFVERPTTSAITHAAGIITGTLTVTPTNQVTVRFVVQAGGSGTAELPADITNRACIYLAGGTLGGCAWSNEVTNPLVSSIYLPLIMRSYTPVRADFTAWPTSGVAPLTVVFTNTSSGGYTASLWNFGDGTTSTQTSPTHTYTETGSYTVTLAVSRLGEMDTLVRPNYVTVSAENSPEAPSHLQATPISWSQMRLDWQDNSSDETGFAIYDGATWVANVGANTISYTVGGLAPESYHCFHIYAFNDYGISPWSDWACATTSPCAEGITNGGFEYDGDWELITTPYPAGYTTATVHSGNRSMRAGIVEPADNLYSHSIAQQTVTIPADAISVTLRFWLYPMTGESPANLPPLVRPLAATIQKAVLASDRQYVLVLNEYDQWINTLIWQRTNDQQWTFHQFDLGVYAGRTIKLQFGSYNDGWDGITAMYVDDVSLEICPSGVGALLRPGRFGTTVPDAWIGLNKSSEEEAK
ncbi:MAG: PKD domain-containing protein [Chloroflexota bacterium]|nr:PKD domain-containing protein [Chloroflexota bacterium]